MQAFKEGKQPTVLSSHNNQHNTIIFLRAQQWPHTLVLRAQQWPYTLALRVLQWPYTLVPVAQQWQHTLAVTNSSFTGLKTCSTRWESCLVLNRNPVKYPWPVNSWILKGTYIHQLTDSTILNSSPNVCPHTQRQAQSSLSSRKILFSTETDHAEDHNQ